MQHISEKDFSTYYMVNCSLDEVYKSPSKYN